MAKKGECYTCGRAAEITDRKSGLRFCSRACANEHNEGREARRKETLARYVNVPIYMGRQVK